MTEFSGNAADMANIIAHNNVRKFNLSKFMNGAIFFFIVDVERGEYWLIKLSL